MGAFYSLRRKLALTICPEMGVEARLKAARAVRSQTEQSTFSGKFLVSSTPTAPRFRIEQQESQVAHIHKLCAALATYLGVTHWAISMRIFGKGDWFRPNGKVRADCRTATAAKANQWFSDHWPSDLEWPSDVPRPTPKQEAA